MKISEKQELVRLLNLYQQELILYNEQNEKEAKKHFGNKWEGEYKLGVKAQYGHARVICAKLSVEIEKQLKTYYDL